MSDLIIVSKNENGIETVNARDLHAKCILDNLNNAAKVIYETKSLDRKKLRELICSLKQIKANSHYDISYIADAIEATATFWVAMKLNDNANNFGHVYVIEFQNGLIKIGKSKRPLDRIKSIKASLPYKAIRCFVSPPFYNYGYIEHEAHLYFKGLRKGGEYFECKFEDAVEFIKIRGEGV